MKKTMLLFPFIGVNWLFAAVDNADVIWTWGNGNSIASILSFLYFLLNIDSLSVVIQYAGLIGMIIVFMREYAKGEGLRPTTLALKMFMFFVITQGTVTFFLTVKQDAEHRVYVLSANELTAASWAKCRPVNGDNDCYAPTGVKIIYSALTNFERAGLYAMESAMMDANALTYSFTSMGYGFGFSYVDALKNPTVSQNYYNTFMEFYENCTLYDLSDGSKSVDDLYKSKDLSSFLVSSNSRLTTVYNTANPTGIVKACYEVASTDLLGTPTCSSKASSVLASASGTPAGETSVNDICDGGENFTQALFNSSKSADDTIKQQMAIYLTKEAFVNSAVSSGLNPSELAYGSVLASREQASKWMTMGVMAKEWLPSVRGIMQGISLGLIWILAILSIATASPAPYLGSAIAFQTSLMIWSFMLSIINYMVIDRMTAAVPNIFITDLGAGDQLTLLSSGTIDYEIQKAMAFLGYMAIASYGISAGLVKFGGNMLSSIGSGITQMAPGMATSSDMARGHQNFGQTESGTKGTQSVNERGDVVSMSPSGYMETQTNQRGHSGYRESASSAYGGSNTIEKTTNADGSSAFKASYGNESVTMNGTDGKVTNANLGTATQATFDQTVAHQIEKTKGQAAALEKSGSDHVTTSIQDTNTTSQQVIKGIGKEHGTAASSEFSKKYNENVQSNLTQAFKDVNGSQETLQKLRGIDMSSGVGIKFLGNGATVTGTSSAKSQDTVSIDLTKEEAQALSKSMVTGLDVSVKSSDSISASQKDSVSHNTENALTHTNQASHDFAQSAKLTEMASKLEKDTDGISTSLKKDLNIAVAQKLINDMGFQRGTDALLHDKGLVERTAQKIIQDKNDAMPKVDADPTFTKASNSIQHTGNNVSPVNMSNPQNIDLNGQYSDYKGEVTHQDERWKENMPGTYNAPTYQDDHTKTKVEDSKVKHDARGKDLIPNAIPDVVRDTANVKFSADGTYSGMDGKKHDWSNKGRTEH